MDSPNLTRSDPLFREYVPIADLQGQRLAAHLQWFADSQPEAFAELAKEISHGNIAVKNTILRLWGVRR